MEAKRNTKNALWLLLYVVLYFIAYLLVCVMGSFHPILFVLYQVTAGILLTGILVKGFDRIQKPFVALCYGCGIILAFFIIGDASLWHCIPIAVLVLFAEVAGLIMGNKKWKTIVVKSVIMSFATFGYYGQIWFNRDFTYQAAVEEMPQGYAETLMACSPAWLFPIVILLGIAASLLSAHFTAKLFKLNSKKN